MANSDYKAKKKRKCSYEVLKVCFFPSPYRPTLTNMGQDEETVRLKHQEPVALKDYDITGLTLDDFSSSEYDDSSDDDRDEALKIRLKLLKKERKAKLWIDYTAIDIYPPNAYPTFPPMKTMDIVKGDRIDVYSLLSNHGKRPYLVRCSNGKQRVSLDSLHSKFVVICCFFVPLWSATYSSTFCHSLIEAYPTLSNHHNCEIVIVPKMRTGMSSHDEQLAFNHFISAFPCLAVPLEDTDSRDFICLSLGLPSRFNRHSEIYCPLTRSTIFPGLVVDSQQIVLQTNVGFFSSYGASSFPFTDDSFVHLARQDDELRFRLDPFHVPFPRAEDHVFVSRQKPPPVAGTPKPVPLDQLLCLEPSFLLRNSGGDKVISVSELANKCVCLFLCLDGRSIPDLVQMHQGCLLKGLDFEIVLISLDFLCNFPSSTDTVRLSLRNLYKVSSFWVLPFDRQVTLKLWRLVGTWFFCETAIFLESHAKSADLGGDRVLERYRSFEFHPFTRKALLEKEASRLSSLTLEALLKPFGDGSIKLIRGKQFRDMPLTDLKGKNVLVFIVSLDSSPFISYKFHDPLLKFYADSQAADTQVLNILLPGTLSGHYSDKDSEELPWLRTPLDSPFSVEELFNKWGLYPPLILAFGKDGLLRSRYVEDYLPLDGKSPFFLFDGDQHSLHEEIRKKLYDGEGFAF